jgi:hypothetical protein
LPLRKSCVERRCAPPVLENAPPPWSGAGFQRRRTTGSGVLFPGRTRMSHLEGKRRGSIYSVRARQTEVACFPAHDIKSFVFPRNAGEDHGKYRPVIWRSRTLQVALTGRQPYALHWPAAHQDVCHHNKKRKLQCRILNRRTRTTPRRWRRSYTACQSPNFSGSCSLESNRVRWRRKCHFESNSHSLKGRFRPALSALSSISQPAAPRALCCLLIGVWQRLISPSK